MTEWHIAALIRIAEKTPPIMLEEAHDFITAELEYNPVLRQDYVQGVCHTCYGVAIYSSFI
jgi:phosphatidylinositol 4-kinase